MDELEFRVTQAVTRCIDTARKAFNKEFPIPEILFNQRGKAAGCARLQTWQLRFNPVLLRENTQAFLDEVVPHEVAHLITYACYGRVKPHGREWQGIMYSVFGLEPKTTHSFDVASVKGKTFLYRCQCSEHELTVRRHNRIQRDQATYLCRKCHSPLRRETLSPSSPR
ncbi:SprT family zinc-dependent metalloprotease [Parasalinivibrio latis]|uniref:SprT family zinc-dependent metalloprotease n=1 Tax=Parasalinivibrio latis TaxID=2952610 RepID=UPI0030E59743